MTEVNEVNFSGGRKMAEGEGGGGIGRLIKILIIVVVLLAVVGGAAWAVYHFLGIGGDTAEGLPAPSTTVREGPAPIANPQYLPLETFIVNLSDGRRYLKTTLALLLNEELAKTYLEARMPEVKDLVIAELQTLSTEQLRDPKERELLKQRLLSKIESLLPDKKREWDDPNPIKKVLITEFYLQ
ncbi:MAG: flagellar basal body-associated FliL family protein [Candidatus Lambdaproteobacteria bacterium]|nr:flagellar basal body-associated FliL family protein [Candidatus Lambdaproteobacteria bacterium]